MSEAENNEYRRFGRDNDFNVTDAAGDIGRSEREQKIDAINRKATEIRRGKEVARQQLAQMGIQTGAKIMWDGAEVIIGKFNSSNQCYSLPGRGYVGVLEILRLVQLQRIVIK